jgi:hypothetical protein
MKLKFIDPSSLDRNLKATVHKSGKIGFTRDASKKLRLSGPKAAMIAVNEENQEDTSLYVIVVDGSTEGAFKINKAGQYYYINTKALFDGMGMDYVNNTYVYDIVPTEIDGRQVYQFKLRPLKKAKNNPPKEGGQNFR